MEKLATRLHEIVEKFMENNVPEETKHEFIVAAVHFNVNLNACSKYDLMRIDHKVNTLAENFEKNKMLTTASIFSYILFREMNRGKLSTEEANKVQFSLFEISTAITDYFTYRIDEDDLNIKLFNELMSLGI